MFTGKFSFRKTGYRAYAVTAKHADGTRTPVGSIKRKWFPHVEQDAWDTMGLDGHRGVHHKRWQAALALVWDGKGYPFPFIRQKPV